MEESYPFPAPDGSPTGPGQVATVARWRDLTRNYLLTGVHVGAGQELGATPATDALAVDLLPGEAHVEGVFYRNTATIRLPLKAADATSARVDRLVLRLTLDSSGTGTVTPLVVDGIPAANPTPRALTQTSTTWDLPLRTFLVARGAGIAVAQAYDPGRYARADPGRKTTTDLPYGAAGVPWRPGESMTLVMPNGRWLDHVYDGTSWCVRPGQVVAAVSVGDDGGKDYNYGLTRIGSRGGRDAPMVWSVPKCLPGNGFRVITRARPLTSGVVGGSLLRMAVIRDLPGGGVDRLFEATAHARGITPVWNLDGSPGSVVLDNPTIGQETYVEQTSSGPVVAGSTQTWNLAGMCQSAPGVVQYFDAQLLVVS